MSASARPYSMTVADFAEWEPPRDLANQRWQLIDGEPVCMAPASINHGIIQSEAAYLMTRHFRETGSQCRSVIAPGVMPTINADTNWRIPDLGVTCSPASGSFLDDPVLLIEILSPSNAAVTRRNVWAYCTIPSVREVVLLWGTRIAAELLRRDDAGEWPRAPLMLGPGDHLELRSIGLAVPLSDFYAGVRFPA